MKSEIRAQTKPEYIDMLTRIIEAYDHLGVVSTTNCQKGLVVIHATEDTCPELEEILHHLPFEIKIEP
ncbi:MAG: DUF4911 domain-containing protein [Syntrophomonadaceae bacterium]|jgi:hypothetical protein